MGGDDGLQNESISLAVHEISRIFEILTPKISSPTFRTVIGGTMNVGVMSVSRSVNAVSVIPAVNSNRDIPGTILPKKL